MNGSMDSTKMDREATAAITGYMYQFDATILGILELASSEELLVEGVEDFDAMGVDSTKHYQCKYYASQQLTSAVIREAVLPMLKGFLALDKDTRKVRRYFLYGYFKDTTQGDKTISAEAMGGILVRRKAVELPSGEKRWVKIDLQNELGASEADVAEFAEALTIRLAEQYEKHKERVYHKLGEVLGISHTEVTEYTYPTALTTVSRLATQRSVSHRKITKESFLALLTPSSALYSIWTLREKGETAYVRHIKRTHFSCLNVDQAERFFVIEGFQDSTKEDLRRLIYRVILHWSSYKSRRKPNQERYAPYFLFVGVIGDKLADIKSLLFLDGVAFVDGYPFQGASFSVAQLIRQQTLENRIAARFVNDFEELQVALDGLARPKFIFHFYSRMATNFSCNCELIRIPVPSLTMIEAIV